MAEAGLAAVLLGLSSFLPSLLFAFSFSNPLEDDMDSCKVERCGVMGRRESDMVWCKGNGMEGKGERERMGREERGERRRKGER
jgi:hypothetical protein